MNQFNCFLNSAASAINQARQDHLASLGLDLENKSVIEVGAGIGLHTPFFLARGCRVTVTDGAASNVEEIKRRHPDLDSFVLDLEDEKSLLGLGKFDVVYCYGLLYHTSNPESVLRRLSEICGETLLLELICDPSAEDIIIYVDDPNGLNQSTVGKGCRPSRQWILRNLVRYFGHGYISLMQPDHPEFPINWSARANRNNRAVFVGSKRPLDNPLLTISPPGRQQKYTKPR